MKNLKRLAIVLLAGTAGFMSCKKDDTTPNNTGNNTGTTTGSMTAKIDGADWKATEFGGGIQQGMMSFTGKDGSGRTITITVNATGTGTYKLEEAGDHAGAYQPSTGALAFTSNAGEGAGGTVTFTKIDATNKLMSGTFTFKGRKGTSPQLISITNGVFTDIKYTTEVTTSNKDLSAKVDGTLWQAEAVMGSVAMGKLAITGSRNDGSSIGLWLPENVTTGTFDLTGMGGTYMGQYNKDQSTYLASTKGKVIITEHNTSTRFIKGTYYFTAEDLFGMESHEITEGKFSTKY